MPLSHSKASPISHGTTRFHLNIFYIKGANGVCNPDGPSHVLASISWSSRPCLAQPSGTVVVLSNESVPACPVMIAEVIDSDNAL